MRFAFPTVRPDLVVEVWTDLDTEYTLWQGAEIKARGKTLDYIVERGTSLHETLARLQKRLGERVFHLRILAGAIEKAPFRSTDYSHQLACHLAASDSPRRDLPSDKEQILVLSAQIGQDPESMGVDPVGDADTCTEEHRCSLCRKWHLTSKLRGAGLVLHEHDVVHFKTLGSVLRGDVIVNLDTWRPNQIGPAKLICVGNGEYESLCHKMGLRAALFDEFSRHPEKKSAHVVHLFFEGTLSRYSQLSDLSAIGRLLHESPNVYASKVELIEQLSEVSTSIGRLEAIGIRASDKVQYLLDTSLDRSDFKTETMNLADLNNYLDWSPSYYFGARILALNPPICLPNASRQALLEEIPGARPLFTIRDVVESLEAQGVIVLFGFDKLAGILLDGSRKTVGPLAKAFDESATVAVEPGLGPAPGKNAVLMDEFYKYRTSLESVEKELAATTQRLNDNVEATTWAVRTSHNFGRAIDRIFAEPVSIAFLGRFNSGKSSIINAILGSKLLPIYDVPTTSTVHVVRHGKPGNQVFFKKAEELRVDLIDQFRMGKLELPQADTLDDRRKEQPNGGADAGRGRGTPRPRGARRRRARCRRRGRPRG